MTRVIALCSGKGGVGKTTLTVNLAAALQQFGQNVLVVDGNITTPNVSLHLGMHKAKNTLQHVLAGNVNVKDAVYMHTNTGLKIIPSSIDIKHLKKKFRKKLPEVILELFGATDMVLIDSAAGLGKDVKQIIESADELVIITAPDTPSMTDALRTIQLAKEHGVKSIGVIINRVLGKDYEIGKKNIQEFLEVPVIGSIPEDAAVKKAIAKTHPVVFLDPDSKASIEIKKIAANLIGGEYREINKNIFDKIRDFLGL